MSGDLVGERLAHYRIVGLLGQGGMGAVYEAFDEKLERRVALKVLREDFAIDEARRKRFVREARSAAAVTHQNIATVHEIGEEDSRVYIAMELVEGRSLRRVLMEGALSMSHVVRIAKDVARGLAKAHDKGIVHRDLKPDNVMVSDDLHVKVLDFGVAKSFLAAEAIDPSAPSSGASDDAARASGGGHTPSEVTLEGQLVGTPAYMSPEQAMDRKVDARSDIFSFGVMLYEMSTGMRPFRSGPGVAVLVATACDTPQSPSAKNPLVTIELERVILRCLAKKPEDRYPSAREVIADLDRIEAAQSSLASLPTLDSHTTIVSATTVPRRRRGLIASSNVARAIAAVALVGALVAVGSWRLSRGPESVPRPSALPSASNASLAISASAQAITDLPAPKTSNPEALASYKNALQAFRDGNFEAFDLGMRDAVRLDPSFAAGELRMAFVKFHSVRGAVTDARMHLQRAARLRSALSERDQALLDVLEPVINREPPDSDELERRLRAALIRWPRDAELLYLLANEERRYDIGKSLATYDRVLDADDAFMTAWRQKAQTLMMRGDAAGARALLDECLRRVPGATGCRNERIWVNQDDGRCDEIEPDARQMIAADPESYRGYEALARAAVALHRPKEAVDELLKQTWQRAPAEVRAREELVTNARIAALEGQFDRARELGQKYDLAIGSHPAAAVHAVAARLLVEVALEIGDVNGAARVAESFLKRQVAWSGAPDSETVRMLHVLRRAKMIDLEKLRAERATFMTAWEKQSSRVRFVRGMEWIVGFASHVENKSDADEALRELPAYGVIPVGLRTPLNDEALGRTSLYAGRADEAVRPLSRAARMCTALDDPFTRVRTHLLLGQALEATGDTRGACAAYAFVRQRWGAAKPRSITADAASDRAKRLHCAP